MNRNDMSLDEALNLPVLSPYDVVRMYSQGDTLYEDENGDWWAVGWYHGELVRQWTA